MLHLYTSYAFCLCSSHRNIYQYNIHVQAPIMVLSLAAAGVLAAEVTVQVRQFVSGRVEALAATIEEASACTYYKCVCFNMYAYTCWRTYMQHTPLVIHSSTRRLSILKIMCIHMHEQTQE